MVDLEKLLGFLKSLGTLNSTNARGLESVPEVVAFCIVTNVQKPLNHVGMRLTGNY